MIFKKIQPDERFDNPSIAKWIEHAAEQARNM